MQVSIHSILSDGPDIMLTWRVPSQETLRTHRDTFITELTSNLSKWKIKAWKINFQLLKIIWGQHNIHKSRHSDNVIHVIHILGWERTEYFCMFQFLVPMTKLVYLNSELVLNPPVLYTVLTAVFINLRDALHACTILLGFIMYMKYL